LSIHLRGTVRGGEPIRPDELPAYQRIERHLRAQIESGEFRVGDRIPTEEALCVQYAVSRMTVRQGLERLVAAGLLVRRRGAGTYVARSRIERVASRLLGFEEDSRAHGFLPDTRVLDTHWRWPDPDDAEALQLAAGEQVYCVERLRFADGDPIGLNTIVLAPAFGRRLMHRDFNGSFYALVRSHIGADVAFAEQQICAVPAEPDQSRLLKVREGTSLLRVERLTYLADGRLVGLTRSLYRGDRYFLSLTVKR
jgi:GntR family transcriptional regulator